MTYNAIFTDLDGTLLNFDSKISRKDLNTIEKIKNAGLLLVAITGRNLFSAQKILKQNNSFDFVIFSNGAGIFDVKNNKIIYGKNLQPEIIPQITNLLISEKQNFFVQFPIGENHKFYFYQSTENQDFTDRIKLYSQFAYPLKNTPGQASQFIVIVGTDETQFFTLSEKLTQKFDVNIIRSTSPLNHRDIWLEIFDKEVSKGKTFLYLCKRLKLNPEKVIGIGNDYNDFDFLKLTGKPLVVSNANIFHRDFEIINSNENHPLTYVFEQILNKKF